MGDLEVPIKKRLSSLQLDGLSDILNFRSDAAPGLIETEQRVIETARQSGPDKAEAVLNTYKKIAEEQLTQQLDISRKQAPAPVLEQELNKARGGLLINIARIWRDAGAVDKCIDALDRAIDYAKKNRWASIATRLESEKHKLTPAST
ncbi:MAG TPA: hypothetical protein VFT49_03665 [Candidatus Saccharimonadales bacterium]|nr:hypothetical protein [Candidatus Saccharimonadales bacterium]